MHDIGYLRDLVIILGFAVAIVSLFHKFKLPSIAGFILAGVLVGPHALGLISDVHKVETLAEIGMALLLFSIGLELSLAKLRRLWKLILAGGFMQVSLSILIAFAVARTWGLSDGTALFIGFLVALSSTAIVLRGLQQGNVVDTPHGRLIVGILVFQDFSVVPMILAIPLLSDSSSLAPDLVGAMLRSLAIVTGVFLAAHLIVPRVLRFVAGTRQRHLFILTVFLICIGTAWAITRSGASLAIGAFLAGLVVAGSEYRHQALADLISFRDVFASLFFVSVGMLLIPAIILENLLSILILLAVIMVGKSLIVFVTALVIRMPLRVCLLSAVALAQIGEFSFVLFYAARGTDLISQSLESNLLSAAVLSMFLTPFAMAFGPRLAARMGKLRVLSRALEVSTAEDAGSQMRKIHDHVIIGGYGFAGLELARSLKTYSIPHVIVDINIENVRAACAKGVHAYFGDVTSYEVLELLGAARAKELILVINDPFAAERAVRVARSFAPSLHIMVRTNYLLDIEPLLSAGADEVIPAERESAIEVTSRVLRRHNVDSEHISGQLSIIRNRNEDDQE
jgi:CPA2 family monovalent cation:H+ antiporter-2